MNSSPRSALSHKPNLNLIWMQTQPLPPLRARKNSKRQILEFSMVCDSLCGAAVWARQARNGGCRGPEEWKQLFALWVIPWKSTRLLSRENMGNQRWNLCL